MATTILHDLSVFECFREAQKMVAGMCYHSGSLK
jgi:hypothetical protein